MAKFKNWTIEERDNLCVLTLDLPKQRQNVLSSAVMSELDQALDEVEKLDVKGLIVKSAKAAGFIVGADVSEFQHMETEQQSAEFVQFSNRIINRIESLTIPSVAMINGHCLGGGLELALACDYRVATDEAAIRIGLPEVKLGIHPGFGGTVRLIEIIGVRLAMDLILSGRTVIPYVAKKMGIIDLCVPQRQLERAAEFVIDKKPPPKRAGTLDKILSLGAARNLIALYLKRQVRAKAKEAHYPAPYAVIELWKEHGGNREAMLQAEQQSIAKLLTTTTARNLVKVFFVHEQLKAIGKSGGESRMSESGMSKSWRDENFQHVHIIGAGVMGGDIAAWCALRGLTVTLHDRSAEALARATKRAYQLFARQLRQPRLVERAMDRFQQDAAGNGAANADVIIEAIFENAEAKIGVFSEMAKAAKPDAILATNTSSIPLETISAALPKPGRLVGLHFFNPVAKMQLIEIVRGEKTYAKVSARAAAFAHRIGRLPIPVKSSPGFLVNRVLMPYTLEAVELLKEGRPAALIDKVATDFGMPMGPITLADTVGLDICLQVGENLTKSFGGEIPELLKQKVNDGHLGKKTGQGFYIWENGRPKKDWFAKGMTLSRQVDDIEDRLVFRYLNECIACLHEGIVDNRSQLDAALIFGTGFAPFTGGPINHITDQQPAVMLDRLKRLHNRYGDRFKPSAGWKEFANTNLP